MYIIHFLSSVFIILISERRQFITSITKLEERSCLGYFFVDALWNWLFHINVHVFIKRLFCSAEISKIKPEKQPQNTYIFLLLLTDAECSIKHWIWRGAYQPSSSSQTEKLRTSVESVHALWQYSTESSPALISRSWRCQTSSEEEKVFLLRHPTCTQSNNISPSESH